ncbi:MAG: hypothetical protein ABIP30_11395 [Ferruginibacter sp.]
MKVHNMTQDEITFKIIGCAMKVHNTLGNVRLNGTGRASRK